MSPYRIGARYVWFMKHPRHPVRQIEMTVCEFFANGCQRVVMLFVAVGGKWWKEVAGRSGVPLEAGLAIERGVPCFLLGGLGGAARDYVKEHPEFMRLLKNGLDDTTNQSLATEENISSIVQRICDQLHRLPMVRGWVSDGISFRILALDGGGIKGAFTASVLATLGYRRPAHSGSL